MSPGDCLRRRDSLFFFQAEDGIRDLVRSRGLGDVYKRQDSDTRESASLSTDRIPKTAKYQTASSSVGRQLRTCLLYTSDAADERSSVDLGGRRIIKKKNICLVACRATIERKSM